MPTVSILGCGWLGLPLAQYLVNKNFTVHGSTTSPQKLSALKQSGIQPYHIHLPGSLDDPAISPFWQADILFINIPPRRGTGKDLVKYPGLVQNVLQKAAGYSNPWIIFASSTSVYSETGGIVKEGDIYPDDPIKDSGTILREAEHVLLGSAFDVTILRFGGLYGNGRHPVQYLSGKKGLTGGESPVNLVHQADCIQIIHQVINQQRKNQVYNVVSDAHPTRKEFYQSAAKHFNLPAAPSFKEAAGQNHKVVSNEKVKKDLDYTFIYPNPMNLTL